MGRALTKQRKYIDINVPNELEPFLDELLKDKTITMELKMKGYTPTLSGVGNWIIQQYLIEHTGYRLGHVNTFEDHITIWDRKLNSSVNVYIRRKNELFCAQDESTDCIHVKFSFQIDEVREILSKKGWELPEKVVS